MIKYVYINTSSTLIWGHASLQNPESMNCDITTVQLNILSGYQVYG